MREIIIKNIKHTLEPGMHYGYNIFIDGNKIDTVMPDQTKTILINDGIHSLYANKGMRNSNSLVIDTNDKDDIIIEIGSNIYDWKMLLLLVYLFESATFLYARRIIE